MKLIQIIFIFSTYLILDTQQFKHGIINNHGKHVSIQTSPFSDCHKHFSNAKNEFVECFAYKLILNNSEKFHDDIETLDVITQPIITKTYENKTVRAGENVTFTCETQIESLPIFLFYKFNLNFNEKINLNNFITPLQDPDAFNDYTSIMSNIKIKRHEHLIDPSMDTKSDFETVDLTVFNTNINDIGYYMCIIANSIKSFRITYAYLNVIEKPDEILTNDTSTFILNNKIENFFINNKYILIIFTILLISIILIFLLSIIYLSYKHKNIKRDINGNDDIEQLTKSSSSSQMNSIIEKTLNSMKKNFVYVTMSNGSNSVTSTLSKRVCLLDQTHNVTPNKYPNTDFLNKIIDMNAQIISNKNAIEYVDDDPNWEFPREKLKIGRLIDEGAFGRVHIADAYGIVPGRYKTIVAVKMLKENATKVEFTNFVKELNIMKNVGKHENIISLLGCCTKSGPIYAIVEYAKYGNLRNYLRSIRPKDYILSTSNDTNNQSDNDETNSGSGIDSLGLHIRKLYSTINKQNKDNQNLTLNDECLAELIGFCTQISDGMRYLHSKKVCHRDLAARNILLDENKVAKIADFGLARDLQNTNYYKRKSEQKVPVKWMSPETLFDHKVYPNSDIWGFGVLMWEVFTLGGNPYPGVPVENLFDYLKEGNRMSKPMYCDDELYSIMLDCWTFKSDQRPSFDVLNERLLKLFETYEKKSKVELKLAESELNLNFKNLISNSNKEFMMRRNSSNTNERNMSIDSTKSSLMIRLPNRINLLKEKRLTRQSESDDSQYFSGTDMSNSLLYVDSSNVSTASSHYSPYIVPSTAAAVKAASIMAASLAQSPPSPPPPKPLTTLLDLASAAYHL